MIVERWKPRPRGAIPVLAGYTILVTICAPLLARRYDLFPAILTLLGLAAILRERPAAAGICLGFGLSAKLYPAVLIPICCAYYLAGGDYRSVRRLLAGSAAAVAAVLAPFSAAGFESVFDFLRYHEMRGLQLESVPAGALLFVHVLGLTEVQLTFDYGAVHLVTPLGAAVLSALPVLQVLLIGGVTAGAFLQFRRDRIATGTVSSSTLCGAIVMALLAFIATNKVFSPQYVIWVLPFAALLPQPRAVLYGFISMLTIAIFPFYYAALMRIEPPAVILLNLRNLLLIGLLGWLLFARYDHETRTR
jgi:uncharacterized membrane protein